MYIICDSYIDPAQRSTIKYTLNIITIELPRLLLPSDDRVVGDTHIRSTNTNRNNF